MTNLDENRELAREQTVAMAQEREEWEQEKDMVGVELRQGDLVLLRRFQVAKHHGHELESQWEGPYRLVEVSYHKQSGRLQDLEWGDIIRVRQGGLRERVHVNDLKLFIRRDPGNRPPGKTPPIDPDSTEIVEMEVARGWKLRLRRFRL